MTRTTVAITGVGGFIAGHLLHLLLSRGWAVRGTARKRSSILENAKLMDHPLAATHLEVIEADLMDPAGFDQAFAGCGTVFHTASPYSLESKDPARDLVAPAVEGTLNVLRACQRAGTVRRVVLTSSMAAVTDEPDGRVLTEADWNTRSSLTRNPYYFAKAEAERAAWAFMEREKPCFDLVVINPFLVIGPSLTPGLNTSNQILVEALTGVFPAILQLTWGMVDVRDVALAHLLAAENESASGRYFCAAESVSMRQLLAMIRPHAREHEKLPTLPIDNAIGSFFGRFFAFTQPPGAASYMKTHLGRTPRFTTAKIERELGLTYRSITATVGETVADLRKWGHLPT